MKATVANISGISCLAKDPKTNLETDRRANEAGLNITMYLIPTLSLIPLRRMENPACLTHPWNYSNQLLITKMVLPPKNLCSL